MSGSFTFLLKIRLYNRNHQLLPHVAITYLPHNCAHSSLSFMVSEKHASLYECEEILHEGFENYAEFCRRTR